MSPCEHCGVMVSMKVRMRLIVKTTFKDASGAHVQETVSCPVCDNVLLRMIDDELVYPVSDPDSKSPSEKDVSPPQDNPRDSDF